MPRPRGRPKKSNTPQLKPKPKPKQKSKTKSKKRRVTEEEGWWTIREVLDERVGKAGQVEYLVQWEDEIHTGESFPPSWVCTPQLTDDALQEWEDKKKARQGTQEPVSSVETTETTESERANASPLTRRRSDTFDPNPRPTKKVRAEQAVAGSEEPVPSIVSGSSVDLDAESTYSLTEDDLARLQAQRLAIVFTKPDNFDASEYQSVSNSQTSSHKVSELEENDQRAAFASQLSQGTIPDSQDLSGHLWTRPEPRSPSVVEEVDQSGAPASPELGSLPHPSTLQEGQSTQDDHLPSNNEAIEEDQQDEDSPLLEEDNQDDHDYQDDEACQDDEDTDNSPIVLDLENISDDSTISDIEESASIPGDPTLTYVDSALDSTLEDRDPQVDHDTAVDSLSNSQDLGDGHIAPESEIVQDQDSSQDDQIVQDDPEPADDDDTQDVENQGSTNIDVGISQDTQSPVDNRSPRVIDDSLDRQDSPVDHAEPQGSSQVSCLEEDPDTGNNYVPEPGSTAAPESFDNNHLSKPSNEAGVIPPLGSPLSSQASRPGQQPTPSSRVSINSLVIPDSQDQSLTTRGQHLLSAQSQDSLSLPQPQVTLVPSQIEVVPDSVTTSSGIPSHQPDQSQPASVQSQALTESDRTNLSAQPSTEVGNIDRPLTSNVTSNSQVFLTQPRPLRHSSELPSSFPPQTSLPSELERPASSPGFRALSPDKPQTPQASQVAQEQPEKTQPSEDEETAACPIRAIIRRSLSGAPSLPSQPESDTMDPTSPNRRQSSAVDELKRYIDFGKDSFLTQAEEPAEPPTSSEAPNHEDPMVTTAVPEVMVSSSELPIQSQPAFSVEPWKAEVLGNTPEEPAPSISPASIMANPNQSAVERMQEIVNMSFGDSAGSLSQSLIVQEPEMMPPGTISPAAIIRSVDAVESTHTLDFSNQGTLSSRIDESSGQEITLGQVPDEQESDVSSQSSHRYENASPHIVTLPMHASRRPYYEAIIVDHKNDIHEFGSMFTEGMDEEPSEDLKDKIDKLFNRLLNICDYPQDIVGTPLERLPSPDLAKYCCDANPKFNFLFELLSALGEKETGILIVARSAELLRLIFAVTEAVGIECSAESIGKQSDYPSVTRITLALTTEEFDPYKFDVVIGYDYGFSSSSMAKQLSKENVRKPPLVLLLTTTHTIEHIALRKSQDMSTLESKNSLLASVILARRYLEDPERGYGDPHQVAEIFSNYLNGMTDAVSWEPQGIPDDVLDVFATNSQSQSLPEDRLTSGNNLKRKHDDDDEDEYSKRSRVLPLTELPVETRDPPLTLAMRQFLESITPRGQGRKDNDSTIEIPISQLESIREKHDEYKRQIALGRGIEVDYKSVIHRLEKELKDYKRTANKIERSNRTALQDRTTFEKEKQKAETKAKAAAETAERERKKLQKHIEELESKIAHLTASPEASKLEDMLRDEQSQVELLTKRLGNAQTTQDFYQHRYQEVDGQATELATENKELKSRHEDLRTRASDNLRKIQEINASQQSDALKEQIKQLTAQVNEREHLLNLAHEELRTLRNGRPQTRGTSVPRSPRVPMMSPRPGRGFTGSASRGTSPTTAPGHEGFMVPGAQFMGQQSRNGRWGHHLQD
ncbi:uncharacterized protein NECHADRAFT_49362 [Fusarium vanettenii 77-13-4]|uniref:Chromo domain-containing protein n=1 Tax=Fusarium vanettenii (strain ATCC MYA-4622 / CBS 123669 / FGSC 9596 / NRRL 45880 / 77-13-4) TaxID=660122 RepID=C7YU25_FUSV7|nr:uncharacterized protein NECHADRAFT_49362 [Fusarium vanettenii 77-13-4]EEU44338.1 hypothetical protein NECHADRAFT_49362 [Fusarium vanettenii 77-13-4]